MCVVWMCQGTPAQKRRRCEGGRVGRGAVRRLGAAVCKRKKESPELWRPGLPLREELSSVEKAVVWMTDTFASIAEVAASCLPSY